jgi:hypothetical protein
MLVVACIFLYVYLFQIDKKYSSFINKEIENFQTLQKFTSESNRNFFLLYDVIYPEVNSNPSEIERQWRVNSQRNSALIDTITNRTIVNPIGDPHYKNMIEARMDYIRMTGELFKMTGTVDKESCADYFIHVLKPGFRKYQTLLERFVEQHKLQLIQYSDNISNSAKKTSLSILFLGFSPLLIVSLILLIAAVIVAVLFLSLKGFDMEH